MKVTLERVEDGYKVKSLHFWKGYKPTVDSYGLAHDLYHHKILEEQGRIDQELQAMGRELFYGKKKDYKLRGKSSSFSGIERWIPNPPKSVERSELKLFRVSQNPYDVEDVTSKHPKIMANINFGYMDAKINHYPFHAYRRVKQVNFKRLHKNHLGNLEVDLSTGIVIKLCKEFN